MIPHKTHGLIAAAVLLISGANFAWAQQKIEEAGIDSMVRDNKVFELEKGHLYILVDEKGVETTNTRSPTHMSVIDCMGTWELFPDQSYKGSGYCTVTDREGDKLFQSWSDSSAEGSKFESIGGTGKFEGAKGQGTYTETELSPGPQGRSIVYWKSSTEYPNLRK